MARNKRRHSGRRIPGRSLTALYRGKSYEEKVLASILLSYHRTRPGTIRPKASPRLARHILVRCAEIDFCVMRCAGESRFRACCVECIEHWRACESSLRSLEQAAPAASVILTTRASRGDEGSRTASRQRSRYRFRNRAALLSGRCRGRARCRRSRRSRGASSTRAPARASDGVRRCIQARPSDSFSPRADRAG